ncbi:hypothetical protein ColTof3_08740 [Colletotrichum tofieldiae]|nr:hypothetical protein ColTof3_08740 [Colletotrichum tofieldiae]
MYLKQRCVPEASHLGHFQQPVDSSGDSGNLKPQFHHFRLIGADEREETLAASSQTAPKAIARPTQRFEHGGDPAHVCLALEAAGIRYVAGMEAEVGGWLMLAWWTGNAVQDRKRSFTKGWKSAT